MKRTPILLGSVVVLALLACKKSGDSSSSSSGNGSMEVKYEQEAATFKVGTAYAIPRKWEDGNQYTFVVYNDGVKDPPCIDPLTQNKPIGGNNWAVTGEMSPIGDPVRPTDKNKVYPKLMVRFFFVRTKGEFKDSPMNGVTDIDNANANLTIISVDGDTITAKIDAAQPDQGSMMKGEFKAKVCTPKP